MARHTAPPGTDAAPGCVATLVACPCNGSGVEEVCLGPPATGDCGRGCRARTYGSVFTVAQPDAEETLGILDHREKVACSASVQGCVKICPSRDAGEPVEPTLCAFGQAGYCRDIVTVHLCDGSSCTAVVRGCGRSSHNGPA